MTDSRPIDSVVLVKQVPDTHNITGEVMTKDGTMNRGALPAIFNPEDLNALEMALQVKEHHGGTVTVLTMGPPKAAEVLRECALPRRRPGDPAHRPQVRRRRYPGHLLHAADARSRRSARFDLVFCGRQAIDGDTAQVGPQTAEKLGIPQITYAETILEIADGRDHRPARLRLRHGDGQLHAALPADRGGLGQPAPPAVGPPAHAHQAGRHPGRVRRAPAKRWPEFETEEALEAYLAAHDLEIPVWTADDIGADAEQHRPGRLAHPGLQGQLRGAGEHREQEIPPTPEGIAAMIAELVKEYIVG